MTSTAAPESATSTSAGSAAWVKNASRDADQICVASVSKPIGLSSSVIGSSFITVRNTSSAPADMPGHDLRRRDPREDARRAGAEAARRLLGVRVHLQQRGAARAERLGQEAHHVREDQQPERLVERRSA